MGVHNEEAGREPSLLVADVGGTHARFAVARLTASGVRLESELTLESRSFAGLADALEAYRQQRPETLSWRRASLALAGPIEDGRCDLTNLGWIVESAELAARLQLDDVRLVNDLEAAAAGIGELSPDRLETLQKGLSRPTANRAVLAPGTGLGEALLLWDGTRHRAVASEGGHADFAPRSELEIELWRHLAERHSHVSLEDVLSGPALVTIHRFLLRHGGLVEPGWLDGDDAAATISARAKEDPKGSCAASVALFCELLGAEAGNVALRIMATGGIYLAGGVVHHLAAELRQSRFLEAFAAKGRHAELLRTVPVHMVLDGRVGLLGAALLAGNESTL